MKRLMSKYSWISVFLAEDLFFSRNIKLKFNLLLILLLFHQLLTAQSFEEFQNPAPQYKPMPFWHINGELTNAGIQQQMTDAKKLAGFSGLTVLPLTARNETKPGTSPEFLSEAFFQKYTYILETAKELDMQVILYDDIDFPSGMAGGRMEKQYPEYTQKTLEKITYPAKEGVVVKDTFRTGKLLSIVALDTLTKEILDLRKHVNKSIFSWKVPTGHWKVMSFTSLTDHPHKKYLVVDYLDSVAVKKFITLTYDVYANRFSKYFGNTIQTTFFDDVGFWRHPKMWTHGFNEAFQQHHGYDPAPFYPCLWEDIGPHTQAHRNAFYYTRAELLAEGYTKYVGQWAKKHGLTDTGHPPGNYDPTSIDMNADIFKFYRYTAMPLTDAIIAYQFGQNGHKLIQSAAEYYDRPRIATEIYGAYKENTVDSNLIFRSAMDLMARGVNFFVPHGMWYNSTPESIHISPLISPYSDKLRPVLPRYSDFVGRASYLLEGGRRVSEIGVLYPFEELAGWYTFDTGIRQGFNVSPITDYMDISGLLTNELRRDFTFIHPEFLLEDKYTIAQGSLKLSHAENWQAYHTLFLTGSSVASLKTLEKLRDFVSSGGTLIATTQLPFKSKDLGKDAAIQAIVTELFGLEYQQEISTNYRMNLVGKGKAIFIPRPSKESLEEVLELHVAAADLTFSPNPTLQSDFGKFNYIHKVKDGKHIYFFSNSSDEPIATSVQLKGIKKLELWNPYTGVNQQLPYTHVQESTTFSLELAPVSAVFVVGE